MLYGPLFWDRYFLWTTDLGQVCYLNHCSGTREKKKISDMVSGMISRFKPLFWDYPFFFKLCARSPSRNQVSAGSAAALRSGTAGPHDGGGTPPGFVAHVHIPAVEHRCGRAGRWLKRMLSRCRPHPSELGVALRCLIYTQAMRSLR